MTKLDLFLQDAVLDFDVKMSEIAYECAKIPDGEYSYDVTDLLFGNESLNYEYSAAMEGIGEKIKGFFKMIGDALKRLFNMLGDFIRGMKQAKSKMPTASKNTTGNSSSETRLNASNNTTGNSSSETRLNAANNTSLANRSSSMVKYTGDNNKQKISSAIPFLKKTMQTYANNTSNLVVALNHSNASAALYLGKMELIKKALLEAKSKPKGIQTHDIYNAATYPEREKTDDGKMTKITPSSILASANTMTEKTMDELKAAKEDYISSMEDVLNINMGEYVMDMSGEALTRAIIPSIGFDFRGLDIIIKNAEELQEKAKKLQEWSDKFSGMFDEDNGDWVNTFMKDFMGSFSKSAALLNTSAVLTISVGRDIIIMNDMAYKMGSAEAA